MHQGGSHPKTDAISTQSYPDASAVTRKQMQFLHSHLPKRRMIEATKPKHG